MTQPALMIFAKQPVPGDVKTRLQSAYTPEQAARIAAVLIRETVALAASNWPGAVYLCAAPDPRHPLFAELAARYGVALRAQGEGDLGARMERALAWGIGRHGAAAVLGCDTPHCPWEVLDDANSALARREDVLGPSDDGGYYLLGLTRPYPELFRDMPWGGARVLALTCARAEALGVEFHMLPPLRDIDTPADLWLAAQQHEALRECL
jgi:rSAM/selenodomain-associated transferase 1